MKNMEQDLRERRQNKKKDKKINKRLHHFQSFPHAHTHTPLTRTTQVPYLCTLPGSQILQWQASQRGH
jgi:hypothetical protein